MQSEAIIGKPEALQSCLTSMRAIETGAFRAQIDAPLGHEILDIPKAQGEPEIQPDHLTNDIRREPMAGKRKGFHHRH